MENNIFSAAAILKKEILVNGREVSERLLDELDNLLGFKGDNVVFTFMNESEDRGYVYLRYYKVWPDYLEFLIPVPLCLVKDKEERIVKITEYIKKYYRIKLLEIAQVRA